MVMVNEMTAIRHSVFTKVIHDTCCFLKHLASSFSWQLLFDEIWQPKNTVCRSSFPFALSSFDDQEPLFHTGDYSALCLPGANGTNSQITFWVFYW